jgi:DNA repair exonuclease SbcCD ATPase subunit
MLAPFLKDEDTRTERLLKLYWNRAGVKRELKSLKAERYELLDKLKDQEDAITRAREQLDGLERLLVNPIAAANAMVYFQLRNIWRIASQRLEQFSTELETQRQKRERKQLHDAALAKRARRLAAVSENVATFSDKLQTVRAEAQQLERNLESMNFIVKLFRGKATRSKLSFHAEELQTLGERIEELKDLSDKIEGEPLPEVEGLSVESRRTINTAVIALAQHLVLHFSPNKLALLARDAMTKTVVDMRFGDRRECDRMVESIRGRIADLKQEEKLADLVRQRAGMLSKELQYRNANDAVPTPFSTPTIAALIDDKHLARRSTDAPVHVNVLADDYWDLSRFLR